MQTASTKILLLKMTWVQIPWDLYEMVMALEDEYGIEIDTDELTDLSTVGDFMEYLKQHGVEV